MPIKAPLRIAIIRGLRQRSACRGESQKNAWRRSNGIQPSSHPTLIVHRANSNDGAFCNALENLVVACAISGFGQCGAKFQRYGEGAAAEALVLDAV